MKKKIIITGANGQLGSELKQLAPSRNYSFIFIDIEDIDLTKKPETLAYLRIQKPDFIINCAAYTAVDKAEAEREKAFLLNAEIPRTLLKFADETDCRIIHISTDYVFSGEKFKPLKEDDEADPKSVYAESKLKGEEVLKHSEKAIIIRTSWLYSSFGSNFLKSMLRLFQEKKQLNIVFDQVGTPTYAQDLANAILQIIDQSDANFVPGIYHFSNEGVASWYDFAIEILKHTDFQCEIKPIESKDYPLPATRPWYAVLNKEKIKQQFKLEIPHWRSSLENCMGKINL